MSLSDALIERIAAVSSKSVPCVFLGVRWVADVQPRDEITWYHECGDECLEYVGCIHHALKGLDFLPGIWLKKTPTFGNAQLVRIGNSETSTLLDLLHKNGLDANKMFDPYTLNHNLLPGVRYAHAEKYRGRIIGVGRYLDVHGKLKRNRFVTPEFESRPDGSDGPPMQWIFEVVVFDFVMAVSEAIRRINSKDSVERDVRPETSSTDLESTAESVSTNTPQDLVALRSKLPTPETAAAEWILSRAMANFLGIKSKTLGNLRWDKRNSQWLPDRSFGVTHGDALVWCKTGKSNYRYHLPTARNQAGHLARLHPGKEFKLDKLSAQ